MARLFTKGNKAATGGRRADAGRRPALVKLMLDEMLHSPLPQDEATGQNLVGLATATFAQAMLDRDPNGGVTAAGQHAAVEIWNRAFGKPAEAREVDASNANLIEFVSSVAKAAEKSRRLAAGTAG